MASLNFDDFDQTNSQSFFEHLSDTLQMPQKILEQMSSANPINFQKLVEKAKRAIRREKAKQRKQVKVEDHVMKEQSKKIKRKKEEDQSDDKKTLQMIRNRISAQNSRDRKKAYLQQLEINARQSMVTNDELKDQLEQLKHDNEKLQQKQKKIQEQLGVIDKLKQTNCRIGKIGLALITLVSVFSIIGKNNSEEVVKLENISNSPQQMYTPPLEKSYTYVDTNTYFQQEDNQKGINVNEQPILDYQMKIEEESNAYYMGSPRPYMIMEEYEYLQNS